ncbi:hypothetical protein [Kordia sp.]|uniref:hypothetical protein n=1 Tax=Kordia sp. TaxID=1965332 RepID=UPI003D272578
MEKRYFVLKKGYLNIDENYFYFSDHGNWETCEILEETENPKLTLTYILTHLLKTFILVIVLMVVMYFSTGEHRFNYDYFFLFFLLIIHFLYRRSKISKFKIPIQKIERLHIESDRLIVTFKNSKNQQIDHTVKLDDTAEIKDIQAYLQEHFNHTYTIA